MEWTDRGWALVSRVGHPVNFGGKKAPYQFAHAQLNAQTCSRKQPPENSGLPRKRWPVGFCDLGISMATHTTNKILLEFEVSPDRTLAALATMVVPVLEEALSTGTDFKPVCQELVSEMVSRTFLFIWSWRKVKFIGISKGRCSCRMYGWTKFWQILDKCPGFVQHLSNLCPSFVNVQYLSK